MKAVRRGQQVLWVDPDAGLCSGPGTVIAVAKDAADAWTPDTRVTVRKADGGIVECYLCELRRRLRLARRR